MLVPDYTTHLFIQSFEKVSPLWDVEEIAKAESYIRHRSELVRVGVLKCPSWFQEELNALDSRMRCFWDDDYAEWILDRRQDAGYYLTVLRFKPTDEFRLDLRLIEALRANDMQRKSNAELIAEKEKLAEASRIANENEDHERTLAAVDSLSTKSLETMARVFEAIETGETIIAHGDDAKVLEEVEAQRKRGVRADPKPHTLRLKRRRRS